MIHKELAVVHLGENLYVSVGVEFEQMLNLRSGHERLLGAVPEMYVIARYALQLVGVDRFVSVTYGFALTVWPNFPAFVKEYINVV